MSRYFEKTGRLIALVLLFCGLLLALIWSGIARQLADDRRAHIAAAVQHNANLAVSLEQYAVRTIRNADALLQLVKHEYARSGAAIDLRRLLAAGVIDTQNVSGVALLDSEGHVRVTNIPVRTDTLPAFAYRDYFQVHRRYPDTLFISTPLHSYTTDRPVIVLSRRISGPGGSFGGVVAVQVAPHTFMRFYSSASLRSNDLISLIAPNGITYARRTGTRESWGEDISQSPLFGHVAQRPVGHYYARDAIHGIPTWFAYRRLTDYPVIATVGASETDILREHQATRRREYRFGVIISVLVALFGALVITVLVQRKQSLERIRAGERRLLEEEERYQQQLTKQIIGAQEREREAIGRELHDNVNQVLTTVKLYLDMAASEPGQAPALLPRAIGHVQDCISEIRNLSRELSAPTLGTRSLVDSINALIDMVASSSQLQVRFTHDSYHRAIVKEQKLALYRILQEALNNVVRHSGASEVHIDLAQAGSNTVLTVRDNGSGFDPRAGSNGIGLSNIRSRARVLGGSARVEAKPGAGTVLSVRLPLPPEAE
ncbi:MAG: sensor histidine kinase [Chitinophagaceae bacterium]|nr:MAG: sensor histidine kinase [Chitinophagaceae bacterium]